MSRPLVSIIVPTRNSEPFIGACLESIRCQTYPNIELIVVDRNSTDRTKEIARAYTEAIFDQEPERSAQRNFGARKSSGAFLFFVDSDMVLSEGVVESCVDAMNGDRRIRAVTVPEESFGRGFWAKCKKLERSFYVGVDWMEAARFMERDAFFRAGGYDQDLVSGEDWDLSQRLEALGGIGRIRDRIRHNEGRISLLSTVRKKLYYADRFARYMDKNQGRSAACRQTALLRRYGLFLSHPARLLRNPLVGIGMLFMKTCEFGFGGLGYLAHRLRKKRKA